MCQSTIDRKIICSGIGLHSGKLVDLKLMPADENTGIVFQIHGKDGVTQLRPNPKAVIATGLATTLGAGGVCVATVEHLLAALRGMEIDNILIEIKGGEVPIMDGSAASFVLLLKSAGIRRQKAPRQVARIVRPISIEQDGKWIKASPYNGLRVNYTIDFAHPAIGVQNLDLEITPRNFVEILAKARTFGFLKEVEYLNKHGLALGGSLDNAVVLDDYKVLNQDGLRFPDEFVRHKILDFIGDMAMLGAPLEGYFEVYCSGHSLNNAFLRRLEESSALYLDVSAKAEHPAPASCTGAESRPEMIGQAV